MLQNMLQADLKKIKESQLQGVKKPPERRREASKKGLITGLQGSHQRISTKTVKDLKIGSQEKD